MSRNERKEVNVIIKKSQKYTEEQKKQKRVWEEIWSRWVRADRKDALTRIVDLSVSVWPEEQESDAAEINLKELQFKQKRRKRMKWIRTLWRLKPEHVDFCLFCYS